MGILGGVFFIGALFSSQQRNQAIQVFCTYYSDEKLNFYFPSILPTQSLWSPLLEFLILPLLSFDLLQLLLQFLSFSR